MQQGAIAPLAVLLALTAGCQGQPTATDSPPSVVATSTILANMAETVGGDAIDVISLLSPGDDPHVYEPVPQDSVAIAQADLIFYNGYDLEPELIRLIAGADRGENAIAVGEVIEPLDFEDDGQIVPDPHVWGSAENGIIMVAAIRDALVERLPADAEQIEANAEALITELQALHIWIGEQIQTIPADQRQLVTTHDAFQYYAVAYGLNIIGTLIGVSTEEQPSAQTVSRLVEAVRAANVPAIFAETTLNPALIATVAQEAGVALAPEELYADALGEPGSGAETYSTMLATNTRIIVEALGGSYSPRH